ncbi:MAG: tetratricopeptide repeat protein [bacterium]
MKTTKRYFFFTVFSLIILLTALPLFAGDALELNNEAIALFDRGKVDEAIQKFSEATALDPDNAVIRANFGYIYLELGRYTEAEAELKRAVALDPINTSAHNNLGISYFYQGKTGQAKEEWNLILRLEPENEAARINLDMATGKAAAKPEIPEQEQAAEPGTEAETLFKSGKDAFLSAKYDEAAKFFENVLEIKPSSLFSHYYLGLSYGYLGNMQSALHHLREYLVMESYPPQSDETFQIAKSTFENLQKTGRITTLPAAKGTDAGKHFASGKQALLAKDYFRAIHYLKEAVNRKPDSFESNYYLGLAYRAVGDRERAVFHLTRCLLQKPKSEQKKMAQQVIKELQSLTGL